MAYGREGEKRRHVQHLRRLQVDTGGGGTLKTLVLGIGNLIMSDDGIGVRVVQQLDGNYVFPSEVTIFDGGTLGLDLLPQLEGVDRLLIVDAVETGNAPGSLVRLTGADVRPVMETKLSPHQMGLKDLLAVAMLQGINPPEMVLLGVQPENIELGIELSAAVAARLDDLVRMALHELETWGIMAGTKHGQA